MGILADWAIGAASSERPEDTSPRRATTLSREIRIFAAVADWPGTVWLSSVKSSSLLPRTPPEALISSIAITIPLFEDWPKLASFPVREAYSPILMDSWLRLHPARQARTTARERRESAPRL